jgi:hypothetical protein
MNLNDTMPEGFHVREDGTFQGIPAWCMAEANAVGCSLIQNRVWDVPCIADAIFRAYTLGLSSK